MDDSFVIIDLIETSVHHINHNNDTVMNITDTTEDTVAEKAAIPPLFWSIIVGITLVIVIVGAYVAKSQVKKKKGATPKDEESYELESVVVSPSPTAPSEVASNEGDYSRPTSAASKRDADDEDVSSDDVPRPLAKRTKAPGKKERKSKAERMAIGNANAMAALSPFLKSIDVTETDVLASKIGGIGLGRAKKIASGFSKGCISDLKIDSVGARHSGAVKNSFKFLICIQDHEFDLSDVKKYNIRRQCQTEECGNPTHYVAEKIEYNEDQKKLHAKNRTRRQRVIPASEATDRFLNAFSSYLPDYIFQEKTLELCNAAKTLIADSAIPLDDLLPHILAGDTAPCKLLTDPHGSIKRTVKELKWVIYARRPRRREVVTPCPSTTDTETCVVLQHQQLSGYARYIEPVIPLPQLPLNPHPSELSHCLTTANDNTGNNADDNDDEADDSDEADENDGADDSDEADDSDDDSSNSDSSSTSEHEDFDIDINSNNDDDNGIADSAASAIDTVLKCTLPSTIRNNIGAFRCLLEAMLTSGQAYSMKPRSNFELLKKRAEDYVSSKAFPANSNKGLISAKAKLVEFLPYIYQLEETSPMVWKMKSEMSMVATDVTHDDIEKELKECTALLESLTKTIVGEYGFKDAVTLGRQHISSATLYFNFSHLKLYCCYCIATRAEISAFKDAAFHGKYLKGYLQYLLDAHSRNSRYFEAAMRVYRGKKSRDLIIDDEEKLWHVKTVEKIGYAIFVTLKFLGILAPDARSTEIGHATFKIPRHVKKNRMMATSTTWPITSSDVEYIYEKLLVVSSVPELQEYFLAMFSAKHGLRISSLLSFAPRPGLSAYPGIKLKDIHFVFYDDQLSYNIDIVFQKGQPNSSLTCSARCFGKKHCCVCALVLFLYLRDAFTLEYSEAMETKTLIIKDSKKDEFLFCNYGSGGRLMRDIPLTRAQVTAFMHKLADSLGISTGLITFKSFRIGMIIPFVFGVMKQKGAGVTLSDLLDKLNTLGVWGTDGCMPYLMFADGYILKVISTFTEAIEQGANDDPATYFSFARDLKANEAVTSSSELVTKIVDQFMPFWTTKSAVHNRFFTVRCEMVAREINRFLGDYRSHESKRRFTVDESCRLDINVMLAFYRASIYNPVVQCPVEACSHSGYMELAGARKGGTLWRHLKTAHKARQVFTCALCTEKMLSMNNRKDVNKHLKSRHFVRYHCRYCQVLLSPHLSRSCKRNRHNVVDVATLALHWTSGSANDPTTGDDNADENLRDENDRLRKLLEKHGISAN